MRRVFYPQGNQHAPGLITHYEEVPSPMLTPATHDAYRLLHDGCTTLAAVEANGIRMDVGYMRGAIGDAATRIAHIEEEMKEDDVFKVWRREYGPAKMNLNSRDQLFDVLFKRMGIAYPAQIDEDGDEPDPNERKNRDAMDNAILEALDIPFGKLYARRSKLEKVKSTYLQGILAEVEGGYLHPFFNLHNIITYRSSSDSPNFQNIPIRDPEIAAIIRRAFIARPGHVLVELDFSQIEVRVAACYHKDPTMLKYIDEGYDMHRDMAMECYKIPPPRSDEAKKYLKPCRQQAKALFTFAEFYGDYYVSVARSLWKAVHLHDLKNGDGIGLYDHLANMGITGLGACDPRQRPLPGTFEHHIMKVEDGFWNVRFPVYNRWKKTWFTTYLQEGGFNTLTGFRVTGLYKRNEVINNGIQGSAFHCLLWSIVRIHRELVRRRAKSCVVGQIHDSGLFDVAENELDWFLPMAKQIMTQELRKAWSWIITPLEIEADVCPPGGSWYDKKQVQI